MDVNETSHHEIPDDIKALLLSHSDIRKNRNSLTSTARNEWICRISSVKKEETRREHINRFCDELLQGKRRPCCRPGCPHRNANNQKRFK